jgi:hypothetical protein
VTFFTFRFVSFISLLCHPPRPHTHIISFFGPPLYYISIWTLECSRVDIHYIETWLPDSSN